MISRLTIAEFWHSQPCDYLATYSFNRGPQLSVLRDAIQKSIAELQQSTSPSRFLKLIKLKRQLAELEQQMRVAPHRKRLTNEQMVIDSTADQIALVRCNSLESKRLDAIFRALLGEVMYAGCLPTYRDALAFYDAQGRLLRVLNICFGCLYMETNDGISVDAGARTYDELRELLITLGHPIKDTQH